MDNFSFLKVLDLKNMALPNKPLLRLQDWFAKYDFSIKHLKRKDNLITVFFSRPQPMKLISYVISLPMILMANPSDSLEKAFIQLSFPQELRESLSFQHI